MKPCASRPCNDCPWRRKSMPGWLGDDTPEHFLNTAMADIDMPCHQTVNYERPDWETQLGPRGTALSCAGQAIFFANILKVSRDRKRRQLKPNKTLVFASPEEFLKHHNKYRAQWDVVKKG